LRGELPKALIQEADQSKDTELPPQTGLQEENVFAPQPDIAAQDAAKARKEEILREFNNESIGEVDEKKPPSNDLKDMGKAGAIKDAAAILYREFSARDVDQALAPLKNVAADDVGARTDDLAMGEPRSEDGGPMSTPGNFPRRAPLKKVTTSPSERSLSGPRLVTAQELGKVPLGLRVKRHKKYDFSPEQLADAEKLKDEKSIANARQRKIKARDELTEEEDERGRMAEAFVKRARRYQATPTPR
jgi:hypothetical protein